ncbi:hypothetical protein H9N25_22045 [Pedobacter riviphilus]|uniref:Uncharacterized protein n=1 Tax=Pedobacter riviphilus TaxID=2766984 RepID=A0ABX6TI11_9SPHI|nr:MULTISPECIES: hypothetical protein [Pedobacter]NII84748.1 hypothetical protein [Pedobacter sp. SG908]QNR84550.1 hypothetical protein H9N25_22045 [Pedobacter riviphilus]
MTQVLLTQDGKNNTIPVSIAQQMTAAFRKSQNTERGTYTEAAWFPAAQISSLTKKIIDLGGDGIRIYFGRYTSEIIDQINKLEYGDKIPLTYTEMNTVLLVVTKLIDGKPCTDYFIDKDYGDPISQPTDPENRADLCPQLCDDNSKLML